MTKINTQKAGFSIIELLFAMVFLAVIIFGVIKLQTSNLTLSNTKQLELKAYSYANQAMEVVSALGYTAVKDCTEPCYLEKSGDNYSIENGSPGGPESLEEGLFQRIITHDETGLTNALLMTAEVSWTDSSGPHKVSVKRVIF